MRRNLFAGFWYLFVLCLILTGCSGQPPVSSQELVSSQDPVSSDASVSPSPEGRDYTVSVEKAFSPPDTHTEVLEVPSKAQYAYPPDFKEQIRISDSVIKGEVTDITFTGFQGIAWIKADIRVTGSLKGSFAENDRVSVFVLGGYIPLQEHIAYDDDAFRFHDMTEEQIEKTVLKETVDGEDFLSIGQDLILCIVPTIDGSPLPEGAYERISPAGQLTAEENGRFVQRIWDEGTVIRKSYSYEEIEEWIQ